MHLKEDGPHGHVIRELQRLKASGKQWACLDFHPELLDRSSTQAVLDPTPPGVPDRVDATPTDRAARDAAALAA
jgi:hypothetical protein